MFTKIAFLNIKTKNLLVHFIFIFLIFPLNAFSQSNIEKFLKDSTTKLFDIDCEMLVEEIRTASRSRISTDKYSVEQIYDREMIFMDSKRVDCKGLALLSNSDRVLMEYGSYIDENSDRINYYRQR